MFIASTEQLCNAFILPFQLTVIQGDLVKVAADAIVHPTNNTLFMGGEVGKSIEFNQSELLC